MGLDDLILTHPVPEAGHLHDIWLRFGGTGMTEYVRTHANDTAAEIAAGVYHAARSFAAAEQRDDITSVIVKVTNAALGCEQPVLPLETAAF